MYIFLLEKSNVHVVLKEKVTPKSLVLYSSLPIASKHSAFSPSEVSASELPAILM